MITASMNLTFARLALVRRNDASRLKIRDSIPVREREYNEQLPQSFTVQLNGSYRSTRFL